jgi:hypothetical protein
MPGWNIFRILGDVSHLASKCILIFAIHRNRSAEGVSMITQILYAMVFCTRYTDLFTETHVWNVFFKIFYIVSSFYIIGIMRYKYARTREREMAWKLGAASLGGSLLISPFAMMIFESKDYWGIFTVNARNPQTMLVVPSRKHVLTTNTVGVGLLPDSRIRLRSPSAAAASTDNRPYCY